MSLHACFALSKFVNCAIMFQGNIKRKKSLSFPQVWPSIIETGWGIRNICSKSGCLLIISIINFLQVELIYFGGIWVENMYKRVKTDSTDISFTRLFLDHLCLYISRRYPVDITVFVWESEGGGGGTREWVWEASIKVLYYTGEKLYLISDPRRLQKTATTADVAGNTTRSNLWSEVFLFIYLTFISTLLFEISQIFWFSIPQKYSEIQFSYSFFLR